MPMVYDELIHECPNCGSKDLTLLYKGYLPLYGCSKCGFQGEYAETVDEARRYWNDYTVRKEFDELARYAKTHFSGDRMRKVVAEFEKVVNAEAGFNIKTAAEEAGKMAKETAAELNKTSNRSEDGGVKRDEDKSDAEEGRCQEDGKLD